MCVVYVFQALSPSGINVKDNILSTQCRPQFGPLLPFNGKVTCTFRTVKCEELHAMYSQFICVVYVFQALSAYGMNIEENILSTQCRLKYGLLLPCKDKLTCTFSTVT